MEHFSNSLKQRHIRSFVRRTGRVTTGQEHALTALWSTYGIDYLNTDGSIQKLNFEQIFSNKAPIVLEIGFGNGEALLSMAEQYPEKNFIGIEVHPPGVGKVLSELKKRSINNVRLLQEDAILILQNSIAENTLSNVNLFFPDPWHKKRHHKRRILQTPFIELIKNKLISGGIFHMATDWEEYAEWSTELLDNTSGLQKVEVSIALTRPETKFERRGKKLGHGVWDLTYQLS